MSPSELIDIGERLFGEHWRQPLAKLLGVDIATLRRWATAQKAIPKLAAVTLWLMLERQQAGQTHDRCVFFRLRDMQHPTGGPARVWGSGYASDDEMYEARDRLFHILPDALYVWATRGTMLRRL